jgi:hypothetical protein
LVAYSHATAGPPPVMISRFMLMIGYVCPLRQA